MKESEVRTKTCPHHNSAMMVTLMMIALNDKAVSDDLIDRQTKLALCSGSECVMDVLLRSPACHRWEMKE